MVIVELSQPSIVVSREGGECSEVGGSSSLFRWRIFTVGEMMGLDNLCRNADD